MRKRNLRGFTLIEIIVGLAVFTLFALGIYSGSQFVTKSVYQSRLKVLETALLNEEIEVIRNMQFEDVGIVDGNPGGKLVAEKQLTRSGVNFVVKTNVIAVDDDLDGNAPTDVTPVDYKEVSVDVTCLQCGQGRPLSMYTRVRPKFLEGDVDRGALFIKVFNANGQPVVNADVNVKSKTDIALNINDTTDDDGMVYIYNLEEGLGIYKIEVTKNGYTADGTLEPSVAVPNPIRPAVSVIGQDITEVSFTIDNLSILKIKTVDDECEKLSDVSLNVKGSHLIGVSPDTLLVDEDVVTANNGKINVADIHWDNYLITASDYDIMGVIPMMPVDVTPGNTVQSFIVMTEDTVNSLLLHVVDSATDGAVSNAIVTLSQPTLGYNESRDTGVGYIRQTNWVDGPGQDLMGDDTRFFAADTDILGSVKVEWEKEEGVMKLKTRTEFTDTVWANGNRWWESSTYDLGKTVEFNSIQILGYFDSMTQAEKDELSEEELEDLEYISAWVKLAISDSPTGPWEYLGPNGETEDYYGYEGSMSTIYEDHNKGRYFRYQGWLLSKTKGEETSTSRTPKVSDVIINYTSECQPPGQAYFGDLTNIASGYDVTITADGYQTYTDTIQVSGDIMTKVKMQRN